MSVLRPRRIVLLAVLSLIAATAGVFVHAAASPATEAVTIDGAGSGRVFDGIGAISGGGGNSRLLIDYPEPERSQILDYLFKPGYGAALQILKVEIGGDTNSTDGAESSHEHYRGDLNCNRGYEWWLMEQAKARNPSIKLYGLAWGAPGWLGNHNFWSTDTVNYLMDWLGCAASHHLNIDYLGGWNEKGYDKTFYENLHAALRAHGYSTQVVGADSGWDVADAMRSDPAFNNSIDIIGTHYPCVYVSAMTRCSTTSNALATGKQLWASENGSEDYNSGGAPMARAINRGYLDAKMTAFINWPLIASIYPNLPYATVGLMVADQPWSGWFDVGKQLWATAHTTQVTQPGWHYIDSASGYFGGDRNNGSYVTLQAPDHSAYSVVAETMDATAPRTVTFHVTGGLPADATLHVRASNFGSNDMADYFAPQSDITPHAGSFTVTLQPGYLYSFTTTDGQGKGSAASPPKASLQLPYRDNFESEQVGREPTYLSQQQGAFEVAPCGGGRSGDCVRQNAPVAPINWDSPANPYTLIGDLHWGDYSVGTDALFEQPGAVQVMGRVGTQRGFNVSGINAYYLQVANSGDWSIVKNTTSGTLTTLASGSVAALGLGSWHHLSVSFHGDTISASIDGKVVGSATDTSYSSGQAGLGVNGYSTDEFDNLTITPIGAQPVTNAYEIVNKDTGLAMSVSGGSTQNQAPVVVSHYTSATSQQWQLAADPSGWLNLRNVGSGDVLTVPGNSTQPGIQLEQWSAHGGANQEWQLRPNGDGTYQIYGRNAGLVADVVKSADGAPVTQQAATDTTSQHWTLVPVPVPVSGGTFALFNRNSGLAMDVSGESTADGGIVIQWPYHGGANQQWHFIPVGGGYFEVVNMNSGKALEEVGTTPGTQLDQRTYAGTANQQWQVDSAGGYLSLTNRATGLVAEVANASTSQGAAVDAGTSNGGTNQQWAPQSPY